MDLRVVGWEVMGKIPVCKRTGYEEPWGEVRDLTPLITESSSCWERSKRLGRE